MPEHTAENDAPEAPLVDAIRKHTGMTEAEARATILRALDRALDRPIPPASGQ